MYTQAEEQRQQATAKRRLAAIQRQETRKAKAAAMNVPFDPEEKDSEDERDAKLEAHVFYYLDALIYAHVVFTGACSFVPVRSLFSFHRFHQ